MNKSQRTIASLFTVIAVLLGVNLVVSASRPAGAQVDGPVDVRTLVTFSSDFVPGSGSTYRMWRAWSDGAVDLTVLSMPIDNCVVTPLCGPVPVLPGTCPGDIPSISRNCSSERNCICAGFALTIKSASLAALSPNSRFT